jgi:membrane fusion protein, multidrug efflux system
MIYPFQKLKLSLFSLAFTGLVLSCEENSEAKLARLKEEHQKMTVEIAELENLLNQDKSASEEVRIIGVKSETIAYKPFVNYFTVNGTVEADSEAMISPEMQGRIMEIFVEKGDKVKKGDALARINTSVLDNQIAEAQSRYKLAKDIFEKQDRLWNQNKIGSEVQYLEAKNNKESLEKNINALMEQKALATIKSPIDGILDDIFAKEGAFASPGQPFAQIINLERLFLNADVSETYLTKLSVGDSLEIFFPALNLNKRNTIHRIGNVINPQNRTFRVRILLRELDESIKPNAMARITMSDFSTDQAIVLPTVAIQQDMQGSYVYVVNRENDEERARKRYVTPEISYAGNTMVTNGINPGEQVIVEGYNRVTDGARIRTIG